MLAVCISEISLRRATSLGGRPVSGLGSSNANKNESPVDASVQQYPGAGRKVFSASHLHNVKRVSRTAYPPQMVVASSLIGPVPTNGDSHGDMEPVKYMFSLGVHQELQLPVGIYVTVFGDVPRTPLWWKFHTATALMIAHLWVDCVLG